MSVLGEGWNGAAEAKLRGVPIALSPGPAPTDKHHLTVPCPACGGRLRGSRLLHDGDGAEVYRVRRCAGCSRVWWDRFALRPLGMIEAPRP